MDPAPFFDLSFADDDDVRRDTKIAGHSREADARLEPVSNVLRDDQEVDVAVGRGVPARSRSEEDDARPAARGRGQRLGSSLDELVSHLE